MLPNPVIINPIPQIHYSLNEINEYFNEFSNSNISILENNNYVWGVFEKENSDLIGLCLLLINDENDRELGYRFREDYWGNGYGTELVKGTIDYCFNELKLEKITADVNIENTASINILKKFLTPVKEYYHKRVQCTNRRYELLRIKN